jgi:hypothetical protein
MIGANGIRAGIAKLYGDSSSYQVAPFALYRRDIAQPALRALRSSRAQPGKKFLERAYALARARHGNNSLLVAIPSSLAMYRYGARRWLACIMICWDLARP